MRHIAWIIAVTLGLGVAGCGGGGSSSSTATTSSSSSTNATNPTSPPNSTGSSGTLAADATAVPTAVNSTNAVPVTVSATGISNQPMVSVTVCRPNSGAAGNCTTIPNVLVDTGSYGLRLFSSVIPTSTSSTLGTATDSASNPLAECSVFVSAYGWGTVHTADIKIGSEIATQVPINVMADPLLTVAPPSACVTGTELTSPSQLGANGILGIGPNEQDCGSVCAFSPEDQFYYTNAGVATTASLNNQVTNPASKFAQDNNGVILEMAQVADTGAATGSGTLVFGIDTQANNVLAGTSATLIPLSTPNNNFTAIFNGSTLVNGAFFDSGSTAMFFGDSAIPHASSSQSSLYTPTATTGLTALLYTGSASTVSVGFNIANGLTLTATGNAAFNDLGAFSSNTLDFGLPFFYGRHMYYGFAGKASAGGGTGPYVAFVSN